MSFRSILFKWIRFCYHFLVKNSHRRSLFLFILYFFLVSVIPFSHAHASEDPHHSNHDASTCANHDEDDPYHDHDGHHSVTPKHDDCCDFHDGRDDRHFHFLVEALCSSFRQCLIKAILSGAGQVITLSLPSNDDVAPARFCSRGTDEPPVLRGKLYSKELSGLSPPLF